MKFSCDLNESHTKYVLYVAVSRKQSLGLENRWAICFHWKTEQDFNKKFVLDQG